MPQALGSFGVHGHISPEAREVLDLANEYRERLCERYQSRHVWTINLRNRYFPELYAAMIDYERAVAWINYIEAEIKEHHSQVRDRNAVTSQLRRDLEAACQRKQQAWDLVRPGRAAWQATQAGWRAWFARQRNWKHVKSLARRREAYAALPAPPQDLAGYQTLAATIQQEDRLQDLPFDAELIRLDAIMPFGELDLECDLRERELGVEYQQRGLLSAIRGEIDKASAPKYGKDGPGMRYRYGRPPRPQPWEKLTLQFKGGLSLEAALEGTPSFRLEDLGRRFYMVHQQIGTARQPRLLSYRCKAHIPFRPGTVFKVWSLHIRREQVLLRNRAGVTRETYRDRALAIPTVAAMTEKPRGDGVLNVVFDIRHCTSEQSVTGVQVAKFYGEGVCERLVLPGWLLDRWDVASAQQAACDKEANTYLASLGAAPEPDQRQGVEALRAYCEEFDHDRRLLDYLILDTYMTRQTKRKISRCIQNIYESAVRRACSRHGSLCMIKVNWAKVKRYATRNLLAQDAAATRARELLFFASPGKLQALLLGYGLTASDQVPDEMPVAARETDVFTSYVLSLAVKTGRRDEPPRTARETTRRTQRGTDL